MSGPAANPADELLAAARAVRGGKRPAGDLFWQVLMECFQAEGVDADLAGAGPVEFPGPTFLGLARALTVPAGQERSDKERPLRYRKRPVEVDAIQWTGQNLGDVQAFGSGAVGIGTLDGGALPLWVIKSAATCRVERGDWIIRETDGSGFYPCAGDVFAATYEPVLEAGAHS